MLNESQQSLILHVVTSENKPVLQCDNVTELNTILDLLKIKYISANSIPETLEQNNVPFYITEEFICVRWRHISEMLRHHSASHLFHS